MGEDVSNSWESIAQTLNALDDGPVIDAPAISRRMWETTERGTAMNTVDKIMDGMLVLASLAIAALIAVAV